MVVGIGYVVLRVHESHSLKDKRKVLKSIIERVKNRFNVSIAEVRGQALWQKAELGVAVVGTDNMFVNSVLDKVANYIEGLGLAELVDFSIEITTYNTDGTKPFGGW